MLEEECEAPAQQLRIQASPKHARRSRSEILHRVGEQRGRLGLQLHWMQERGATLAAQRPAALGSLSVPSGLVSPSTASGQQRPL